MISVGMCLVIATAGIDLSVGSVMAAAGAVAMEFLASAGGSPTGALGALGLALLLGAALGAVNAVLVSVVGLQPFISTLVLMLAGRGLAKVITGGQNTAASNDTFRWLANGYVFGIPVVFLLAVAIVILVGLDRKSTRLNSSHVAISYAVFCLKKKNKNILVIAAVQLQ